MDKDALNNSMKLLFCLLAFNVCAGSLRGEEGYPDFSDPLERLVYGGPSEASPPESEEVALERERAIAEFPGGKDRLFQLFERDYKGKSFEWLACSMNAISVRPDLVPDDLKEIDHEMSLVSSKTSRVAFDKYFLIGGMKIYGNYPSPQREELVLRLAYDDESSVAQAALRSLVEMGSEHAGKALDDAIQRTVIPGKDQSLNWKLTEMRALKRKVDYPSGQRERKERIGESSSPVSPRKPEKAKPSAGSGSGQSGHSKPTMAVGLIAAAIGLLWLLLKKRK